MATNFADDEDVEFQIVDILNAARGIWGGDLVDKRRSAEAITGARKKAYRQILSAIASNPEHGFYGEFITLVDVAHNAFLTGHDGEPCIPLIFPFDGAEAREGIPADPDEIDSYRNDPLFLYSTIAHDQADENGMLSPLACKYSLINKRLKYTGLSAKVPLFLITDEMQIPLATAGAAVKLAIPLLVKEGDNLAIISERYRAWGQEDLIDVKGGSMKVRPAPMPSIAMAQKSAI